MTKKFMAEYTSGDIASLYQQRKNDGEEARLQGFITSFRSLCKLEHEVKIPGEYKAISREVRTPFIRDAWHRIASSLVAKPPVTHCEPKDKANEDYRRSANIAERWDSAMVERLNKERQTDLQFNLTAQHVRDGESILKVVHRPDAWANFPQGLAADDQDVWKRNADFPIAWRDIDRLQVLYDDGEYGDEWILEYGEYARPWLKQRYKMVEVDGKLVNPKATLEGRGFPEGMLTATHGRAVKLEFLTTREWHVIVDGGEAPGFPKPNPYAPHLNYFRAPAYERESLLYSLLFLVPRMDELLTMKLNWGVLGAYPNPVIETEASTLLQGLDPQGIGQAVGPSTDTDAAKPRVVWKPGKAIELPVGQKLSFLIPPPVGRDLNELAVLLKSLIDIAGVPSIMRGGAAESGYLASQMRAAAEMAYKISMLSLQRQQETALDFCHWLVAHKVKQTVYVNGWSESGKNGKRAKGAEKDWLGLSPDKGAKQVANYKMLGPVSVQYRAMMPTDAQANAMIAMQLTNAAKPLMGVRDALEKYLQEEDPEAIMERMAVEDAMQQEPLASTLLQRAMEDAGLLPPQPPPAPVVSPLVGPGGQPMAAGTGQPMELPGPSQLQPVPLAQVTAPGMPQVPGVNMPLRPNTIPGRTGGRPGGMYPGMPGGPGNG